MSYHYYLSPQKEERVSELRNQLSERQALRSRRRASTVTNQNHSSPPLTIAQSDPRSLAPPPGYPAPTSDPHTISPSFANSSSLYQPDSKISRNNCHASRLQLLYKWDGGEHWREEDSNYIHSYIEYLWRSWLQNSFHWSAAGGQRITSGKVNINLFLREDLHLHLFHSFQADHHVVFLFLLWQIKTCTYILLIIQFCICDPPVIYVPSRVWEKMLRLDFSLRPDLISLNY